MLCIGAAFSSGAQTTSLPYFTGFENAMPPWQMIRKGATDPYYKWSIDNINPYAGTSSIYHGYPVGGTVATDDWFVSPAFSFSTGGKIDSVRHNFSGFGLPQAGDTVAIYLLTGNADPALATKKLLRDFRGSDYVADHNWNQTTNITIPPTAGTSYIAFRYRTVSNWLDVRFDNLRISGNSTGLHDSYIAGRDFSIAPNPVVQHLAIRTSIAFAKLNMYDLTGKKIISQVFQKELDLSQLTAGSYILELIDADQHRGFVTIIKQ